MNIYLDIDGVLLASETSLASGADQFLQAILALYPGSTYWLTTHCWRGENSTIECLSPLVDDQSLRLLPKVRPTEWGELKTDAINFDQDFLWFDDDLLDAERQVLVANNALDKLIMIDLAADPLVLKKVTNNLLGVSL